MSILDLDAGNSRLKWRLIGEAGTVCSGVVDNRSLQVDDKFIKILDQLPEQPVRCRLSSVRADSATGLVIDSVCQVFGLRVEKASPVACLDGTHFERVDVTRFGCDRWLALLAARRRFPGCTVMVVDSGTALTLDAMDQNGRFLGGMIVPGLVSMLDTMVSRADGLTLPDMLVYNRGGGFSTAEAMQNGVASMAVALVENEYARLPEDAIVILSGGDAEVLSALISIPVALEPDLVLDGLAVALP